MNKRVVITGMSAINASGIGTQHFWKNISAGINSITHIPEFATAELPTQVAGRIRGFDEKQHIPRRFLAKIDTFTKYAWAVADWALKDSNIDLTQENRQRVGAWLGNNAGGWDICERGLYEMYRDGVDCVNPWQATAWFLSSPQGYLTIAHDLHGMSKSFACDRASSASALFAAFRNIQSGDNEIILSGGTEAPITPFAMNCYYDIGEMATSKTNINCYKPFDKDATGLVIGEGAAIVILEEYEHAKKRGANILGEIIGAACFTDVDTRSNVYWCRAMETALKNAQIKGDLIDVVFGEGCGVPELDDVELSAINSVFKSSLERLHVTFPKSGYGHLYGASTVTDLIAALLCAQNQKIVPTPNVESIHPHIKFNLVTSLQEKNIHYCMVNSRAREGTSFSFVIKI